MSTSGTTGLPKGVPVPLKALVSFRIYMIDAVDLARTTVLEHRRPGLGLRALLRRDRAADARPRHHVLRRPLHRREHLPDHQEPRDHQSRRRADRLPPADRGRAGAGGGGEGRLRAVSSRRRAAQPRGHPLVRRAPFGADQRPLRPDRTRHGGRQPPWPRPSRARPARPASPCRASGSRCSTTKASELGAASTRHAGDRHRPVAALWFTGYPTNRRRRSRAAITAPATRSSCEPTGHITFVGRNDDVITSSGYRIGPFDVESALIEHPAVSRRR